MATARRKSKARTATRKLRRAAGHYPVGTIPGQPAGRHKPFKSRAQWRLFFANPRLRKYAIGKAHATGGHSAITHRLHYSPAYRALPPRKPGATTASRIRHTSAKGRRVKR